MQRQEITCQKIVYVCLNQRESGVCCAAGGGDAVHARLKAAIKSKGLNKQVRVSRSGCMDKCPHGPNVLVFPEGVWYSEVAESDCDAIVEEVLRDVTS